MFRSIKNLFKRIDHERIMAEYKISLINKISKLDRKYYGKENESLRDEINFLLGYAQAQKDIINIID